MFIRSELAPGAYPVQAEFLYGEWLRRSFEAGQLPVCVPVAGNTLLLAQARQDARCLSGADVTEMVPEISMTQVKRAMRDALPALMGSLHGDERNVLLTLARMWRTDVTEEFVAKDVAATWASTRMPDSEASILGFARDAHLGLVEDVWEDRRVAAADAADFLMRMISESGRAQQLDPHG